MPDDGHAHRISCALPRKVVRRRAYATKAKYHVTTRHAGLECGGNLLGDVAQIICPSQLQAARF